MRVMRYIIISHIGRIVFLLICCYIFVACSSSIKESDIFCFDIQFISDKNKDSELAVPFIGTFWENLKNSNLKDGLIFKCLTNTDYHISVSSTTDGTLNGLYCRRGRAGNEIVMLFPKWEFFKEDDMTKALLYSYPKPKLFVWNISKTLDLGKEQYDRIVTLHSDADIIPFTSIHYLDKRRMIAYNSEQNTKENSNEPAYEIYDTFTGQLQKKYELFNKMDIAPDNPLYTSKNFLSNIDCIKPDRTKLALGMTFLPYINIIDIETGNIQGFRIQELKKFTLKERIWHFTSLECDDEFIYALYSGRNIDADNLDTAPNILYVFDWYGNIVRKYHLDNYFTELHKDGDMLYFSRSSSSDVYGISIELLKEYDT